MPCARCARTSTTRTPPRTGSCRRRSGRPRRRRASRRASACRRAAVRDVVPAELSRQLAEALRDLLLALRAVLDWYIERLGEPAPGRDRVEVEDIPLD